MRPTAPLLAAALAAGCVSSGKGGPAAPAPAGSKPGLYAVLATARGDVEMRLFKDEAPKSVAAFVLQGKSGGYDGVPFARAVPGFLVQAAARAAGEAPPFEALPGRGFQDSGRVAIPARDGGSAPGEFFITVLPAPWLDGKHAVFGEVTKGLALLDAASREPAGSLRIESVRFEDRP